MAKLQHRLIHDVYVLLDDGDRRVLEELHLSPLEFSVLRQLDAEDGRRLTDVGATLLCVKSTITRVADRLERNGLLMRSPDPSDRRAQRLLLTPKGSWILERAIRTHDRSVERRMSKLSADEQHTLGALLAKLRDHLHDELDLNENAASAPMLPTELKLSQHAMDSPSGD
jgi:DNA-binding MarR family transcriptional regulator